MPSSIGHALTAVAIGAPLAPATAGRRFWFAGILCTVLPDLDALGRPFRLGDVEFLGGHRALTHSILFAVIVSVAVTWSAFRSSQWNGSRGRILVFLLLAMVSHGVLDAFTAYGGGVAFLYPFTRAHYVAEWQPVRGLVDEALWIWLPAAVLVGVVWRFKAAHRSNEPHAAA
jgi:inner membrane protein